MECGVIFFNLGQFFDTAIATSACVRPVRQYVETKTGTVDVFQSVEMPIVDRELVALPKENDGLPRRAVGLNFRQLIQANLVHYGDNKWLV